MTRAALVPFLHGRVCLAVSGLGALPPWNLGRLICREHDREGCPECSARGFVRGELTPMRRDVTPEDVAALVADIYDAVRAYDVEHVTIEDAQGSGEDARRAKWIASEAAQALACVAEVAFAVATVRANDIGARAAGLLAQVEGGKDGAEGSSHVDVGRRSAERGDGVGNGGPELATTWPHREHPRTPRPVYVPYADACVSGGMEPALAADENRDATGGRADSADRVGMVVRDELAPRLAGIDPGSHWIAIAVAAGTALPLRYVASTVIDVGYVEPLDKPRTRTRKNGTTYTIANKRIIKSADRTEATAKVVAFLIEHGVTRVNIEETTHFRPAKDPAMNGGRAARMLRSERVAGVIEGHLCARAAPAVVEVDSSSSKEWRGVVCRIAGVPAKDDAWEAAIRVAVSGLPETLDEHEIDAAGALTWLVRDEIPSRRGTRGARGPRERAQASADAKERHRERSREYWRSTTGAERARARAEAGCTCPARHRKTCPLYVDRRAAITGPPGPAFTR